MTSFFIYTGVFLLLTMSLVLYRMLLGPTIIDRIVSVNVIGTKTTLIILFIGLIFKRVDMFVDIALAYALLNFIASVAAARYLSNYKALHPKEKQPKGTARL